MKNSFYQRTLEQNQLLMTVLIYGATFYNILENEISTILEDI